MKVVTRGELAGVSHQGDRCTCRNLVSCLLEKLVVVLVYRDDVSFVLYLDGMSGFVAPSRKYHGAVESGLDYRSLRCGDVHIRVYDQIISL